MKLINKTQRIYLVLLVALLLVWSGLFLWAISGAIKENIDETLNSELLALLNQSWNQNSIQVISTQQMEITPIPQVLDDNVSFTDTTLFNSIEYEDFPYRQVRIQAQIAGQAYQITLRRSLVEYDDLFETILFMELIFVILLIGGLFIINRNILQRLWSPFYHALKQITGYKISDQNQLEWSHSEIDEFEQLNRVLEEMILRIEKDYDQLKQFTENAAHELQTPLSVIQNQIEMLIQDEEILAEDQWQRLHQISTMSKKLSRLTRALLLLTKIENQQYSSRKEINLTHLIESLIDEYRVLAESKEISVNPDLENDVTLLMNPDLAEMMFRNLLSNAIKHNHADGSIEIILTKKKFTIVNTGLPLYEDASNLFNRFQKATPDSESLGLGLSIVKTIVEASNLSIHYQYANKKHIITVHFD